MAYSKKEINEILRNNSYKRKFIDSAAIDLKISDRLKEFLLGNRIDYINHEFIDSSKLELDVIKVNKILEENIRKKIKFASICTILYVSLLPLGFIIENTFLILLVLPILPIFWFYSFSKFLYSQIYSLESKFVSSKEYKNVISSFFLIILDYKNKESEWQKLTWQEFEIAVSERLSEMGLESYNTSLSNDEGVDVVLTIRNRNILIQCKKYSSKIGTPFLRNLIGSMKIKNSSKGIVITTGTGFSKPAIELAENNNILLLDLADFLGMKRKDFENL